MKNSKKPTGKAPASSDTRRLVVISDLHAGSIYAPCPANFERHDGNVVTLNRNGQFATKAFKTFTSTVLDLPAYDLLLNGDLVEGMHHRSTEVWSMDPGDHVRAAMMLLDPIVEKARQVWVTRGTECHTQGSEESLGMYFGAKRDPDTGRCAPDLWRFDYCGLHIHAVHHMPTTSRKALEGSQLSIQLNEHQSQSARADIERPRLVIASHRHTPGLYTDFESMMIATPAWQTADGRHVKKVVPASKTRVGGMVLDWSQRIDGDLPFFDPGKYIYAPEKE